MRTLLMRVLQLLLLATLLVGSPATLQSDEAQERSAADAAKPVDFNRDVRPILSDNCFSCHGPDASRREATLRLDVRDDALAQGAFVPGNAEQSLLIERIFAETADELMPPPDSGKELTSAQKEALKRWVDEGAKYQQHWAFVPPAKSEPPQITHRGFEIRSPIDAFIQARLVQEGLTPSPEASKATLIRRVTLDLTGLPPTPAEVDAFLQDETEHAYENVVDRLLNSPHYGERMAIDWLDAARYADSNGYQVDRDRELWPWRDWIIRAFNDNMPFDQFTVEQLAGDLLPAATLMQRIATGFHRNHMLNEEGGIIAEEFLAEYTADRVETTAAVWLGQTFTCARCHDHKFDPFTQRDYYALKAFFHNVPERGVGIYGKPIRHNAPPFVRLPAPEIEAKIDELTSSLNALNDQLNALADDASADLEEWTSRVVADTVVWEPLELLEATSGDEPLRVDSSARSVEIGPQQAKAKTVTIKSRLPVGRITALRLECSAAAVEAGIQWSGLKVLNHQPLKLRAVAAGDSLSAAETAKLLDENRKTRVVLSVQPRESAQAVVVLERVLENESPVEIAVELQLERVAGEQSRWRLLASSSETELLVPSSIRAIASKQATEHTAAERQQLTQARLAQQPAHRRLSGKAESLKKQIAAAELEIPTTLVMEELPEPRATFVLLRGAYDKPGEQVRAATPAVLPELDEDLPRNRLGLAKWLVSPRNPLTARVTVNRFWQQLFGTGLVRTSEDFGSQGELPSHPDLLDWLATTFRESGWDVKELMKLMVTSATYRQRSDLTPELLTRDLENRLLARGPRFRLPAELIRDQALSASGLLVSKLGGPSVKPYHPPGLYEQVTAGRGYNVYVPGTGDDLHRRSLYTYWKRSVPHPAMLLFDAPFRETCTLRRPRSNTPLQALNLMNDPTYVEAARFLAQRMMHEGGGSVDSRLTYGFRLLLSRAPQPAELAVLQAAFSRARKDFQVDTDSAKALLTVGEARLDDRLNVADLAAFTTVASTMLNLDEVITKE
jgi:cytochrome c553